MKSLGKWQNADYVVVDSHVRDSADELVVLQKVGCKLIRQVCIECTCHDGTNYTYN